VIRSFGADIDGIALDYTRLCVRVEPASIALRAFLTAKQKGMEKGTE
jgi:hypothetical protein